MPNWVHSVSALAVTLCGALLTFDWTSIASPHTIGIIVTILGGVKAVAGVVAPSSPVDPVTGK